MAHKAASMILRRAREGDLNAQVSAAKLYLHGNAGIRRDAATAFYWLRSAAAGGSGEAQRLIGTSIPPSSVKQPGDVVQYYEAASRRGSANADVALTDWLLTGRIATADRDRAYELLHRAAQAGRRQAQLRLALLLNSGAFGQDRREEALAWFESAARLGSRAALLALSNARWDRHDSQAIHSMNAAGAADNDAEHLYRRGTLLLGEGNLAPARPMVEKAALLDHAHAQVQYAMLHALGPRARDARVPHSLKKAAAWLEKSSRTGNPQASYELYRLFSRREFSLKSRVMAQTFLQTAAEQGHAHARFLMGCFFLRDRVSADADISAARWFILAEKQDHVEARAVVRALYVRPPAKFPAAGVESMQLIRTMARSRIALATRLELASAFGLNVQETLLFDPALADRGECLLIDVRAHLPRARRRILVVASEAERALLDRAGRLFQPKNPHPTDVRGTYGQRKLDFEHTLTILGARASHDDERYW